MPQLLAIVDCDVMPASEARISVTDPGLLRGDGVFEVIRLYDSHPFAFDDHLDRLERSAAGLRLPLDRDTVRQKRPKRSSSGVISVSQSRRWQSWPPPLRTGASAIAR